MKQTSVEWFAKELKNLIRQSELTDMKPSFFDEKEAEILEQANQMFGEQIIEAYEKGQGAEASGKFNKTGIKYYNKTFKL